MIRPDLPPKMSELGMISGKSRCWKRKATGRLSLRSRGLTVILCVPLEEVTVYHQTSGTTGQPIVQPDTWQDWEWWAETWCQFLWAMGFRNTDRVFLPLVTMYLSLTGPVTMLPKNRLRGCLRALLNTEERILKMKELRATAFMATPTYVLGMADTAGNWAWIRESWGSRKSCARVNRVQAYLPPRKGWKMPGAAMYTTISARRKWVPGDMSVCTIRWHAC